MNNKKFKTQVTREHYYQGYDSLERFISYFYQIKSVIDLKPSNVLEVGIGNKTVSDYLKRSGYQVTTCDFAKDLEPDVVADVRMLPFKDDKFDVILAAEVLEHIPFDEVAKALSELRRVSKKYLIVSIPSYGSYYFELIIKTKLPLFYKYFRRTLRIPFFSKKITFHQKNQEHFWEIWAKGYSKRRIRKIFIESGLKIIREFQPPLNFYHYFFILEKK